MFNVGLLSGKCLFQLQAERLQRLATLAGATKPVQWYVMTSEATDAQTEAFFAERNYFGLDKSAVHFFEQGGCKCRSHFSCYSTFASTQVNILPFWRTAVSP